MCEFVPPLMIGPTGMTVGRVETIPSNLPGHNHDRYGAPTYPTYRALCPMGCDLHAVFPRGAEGRHEALLVDPLSDDAHNTWIAAHVWDEKNTSTRF